MGKTKTVSLALALFMAACLLAGCANSAATLELEEADTVPKTPYEIRWCIRGTPPVDVHSVEMAVNEYLADKINATVKLNIMNDAQYKKKVATMIAAAEPFDLCFVCSWMLDYKINAISGAFFALDDYLDTYLKGTTAQMSHDMIESARVNEKIYALPVIKETATQYGWVYRKDIAKKYNLNMGDYKSFEELEPVLHMIKENEPDIQYPIDWESGRQPATLLGALTPVSGLYIFPNGLYPIEEVHIIPENGAYRSACELARRFYNDGLVKKDVMTATDLIERADDGKTFCFLSTVLPGKPKLLQDSVYEWDHVGITEPRQIGLPGLQSMTALSATSKNPVRVLRFLELLNTDPYLKNLLVYGIEDKHYTKNSDGTINVAPDSTYNMYVSSWSMGNVFLDYIVKGNDPQLNEKLLEFSRGAKTSKADLFSFDGNDYEQVVAACASLSRQYIKQCSLGALEPGPVLDEFAAKLKAAGIDELKKGFEEQYGEYLKTLE